MKHTSLLVTAALAIAVFGVFVISQPSSAQTNICPTGLVCTPIPANCPPGYLCLPNSTAGNGAAAYVPTTWFNAYLSGTGTNLPTINRLGNYKCVTANGTIYAADAAQCSDIQKTNLGVGIDGNAANSYPDSNPTVKVSSSTITQTTYYANGQVDKVNTYLTSLPTNNGITSANGTVTITAYKSCTNVSTGSTPCFQGNGSVTISSPATATALACPAGATCIDSMPAPSATSIRPMPACKASLSFDAANRIAAALGLNATQTASLLSPSNLHLAAIALTGNTTVSQQIVPRTGDVYSANPKFDSSTLAPNVISQTYSTTKFAKAVFDLCFDAGYVSNTPTGIDAATVIGINTPSTQFVKLNVPQ